MRFAKDPASGKGRWNYQVTESKARTKINCSVFVWLCGACPLIRLGPILFQARLGEGGLGSFLSESIYIEPSIIDLAKALSIVLTIARARWGMSPSRRGCKGHKETEQQREPFRGAETSSTCPVPRFWAFPKIWILGLVCMQCHQYWLETAGNDGLCRDDARHTGGSSTVSLCIARASGRIPGYRFSKTNMEPCKVSPGGGGGGGQGVP